VNVFASAVKNEVWKVDETKKFFCGHDEGIVGGMNNNW
jgi:hypothetical protein